MSKIPTLHTSSVPPEAASRHFDPVLRPDLAALYTARAARLRSLAEGHDLAAYLGLAADMAEVQAGLAGTTLPRPDAVEIATSPAPVLLLQELLAALAVKVPQPVALQLGRLSALPEAETSAAFIALAEGRFGDVDPAFAPFLWAALSTLVARAARSAPLPPKGEAETSHCPVCGCQPVASLIHTGERQGMRYLHCALCECDWHMVRAKCSNCGDAADLDYLSFDTPEAAIRAEACGACDSYLKVINQEREPEAEAVADDLASLLLDDAAGAEGFGRTGFNPFALPGEAA